MSLHEISGGRDSNRERNDVPRSGPNADAPGNHGADEGTGSHRSPSSGGPGGTTNPDTGEAAVSASEQATTDGTDDGESEPATAADQATVPNETPAYVRRVIEYDRSRSDGDYETVGMQSRMGQSSTERASPRCPDLPSEIARQQASKGGEADDSGDYDPACARASWFLAARRR
ncbi:hypothetical protein [Halosimplex halobium]|uniref:hypothetical protein n=1 Tax=Halosimplex halobium TaxID=3396618 RepID=UPI003F5734BD